MTQAWALPTAGANVFHKDRYIQDTWLLFKVTPTVPERGIAEVGMGGQRQKETQRGKDTDFAIQERYLIFLGLFCFVLWFLRRG